jgi:predicted aldo/keto reductase-like oxidoreductase
MRLPTLAQDAGLSIRQPFSSHLGGKPKPVVRHDRGRIDEPLATAMLRHGIDSGVNYVDTAYFYHEGNSEHFVGRALQDGYRQKVHLATKLPTGEVSTADDFDRLLNEQLQRLQTDHVDFYLLHGLNKNRWPKVRDLGVLAWSERARADGRIGHLGFSFHDTLDTFKEISDAYDGWALCQIQYNYVDTDVQAGTEGLRYAADRGLAVVVMEPVRGGRLASLPQPVVEILQQLQPQRSLAALALHWVWNQPEVSVALSGMSTMEQVVENLASADESSVGSLTEDDLAIYEQARDKYRELCPIPCTECRYCLPCPNGVFIHANLAVYNQAKLMGQMEQAKRRYAWFASRGRDMSAAACIQCRECEERCPQGISISEWMPEVHALLAEG